MTTKENKTLDELYSQWVSECYFDDKAWAERLAELRLKASKIIWKKLLLE